MDKELKRIRDSVMDHETTLMHEFINEIARAIDPDRGDPMDVANSLANLKPEQVRNLFGPNAEKYMLAWKAARDLSVKLDDLGESIEAEEAPDDSPIDKLCEALRPFSDEDLWIVLNRLELTNGLVKMDRRQLCMTCLKPGETANDIPAVVLRIKRTLADIALESIEDADRRSGRDS